MPKTGEFRTRAATCQAGTPMDEQTTESSADAPPVPEGPDDPVRRRRRRWLLPTLLVPVVLLIVIVIAWAVDTSGGGVPRNVRLAGADVGGLSEAELSTRVASLAEDFTATPVELVEGENTYRTTAGEIGLMLDDDRTTDGALAVGENTATPLRPFVWLRSFVTERTAPLEFRVNNEQLRTTTLELEGEERTPPTEPTVELVDGTFHVVAGEDGTGIDPAEVAAALPRAAGAVEPGETIRIEVEQGPIPPSGSDEDARAAAAAAEALVDEPVVIQTSAGERTIEPDQLRTWVTLASEDDGSVEVAFEPARVALTLRGAFADIEGHPVDARITLGDAGAPIIIPDQPGTICCADGSASRILTALRDGTRTVGLDLAQGPAGFTTAQAEAYGITQPVGGNHAWRSGAPTTAGPGFTTYHAAAGARVTNIHRIADLVRGVVVPPGGTFSVNDHVGRRTAAKGFVAAGAIANGEHVDEIGGGISQFATTTFNAAYFAGLEITEYQAHSEYFDRYPLGREATMGFPEPDLAFRNDTPYGILIWTSYTDTSLTVTLYSTPHATAEQTGISESREGRCRIVVTTRTRTFPDGRTDEDTFRARYRPGPGQGC
jgi:vancomycin resistance protein YoaR